MKKNPASTEISVEDFEQVSPEQHAFSGLLSFMRNKWSDADCGSDCCDPNFAAIISIHTE